MRWIQRWTDALFFHYPVDAGTLAPLIAPPLEIDLFRGLAWLGFIFFRLQLRPEWGPAVPGFSSLVELNVRTYVRHRGKPGICFLRMFADNAWAIFAARRLTPLDYRLARLEHAGNGADRWTGSGSAGGRELAFRYEARAGAPYQQCDADTLEHFLVERYRLYVPVGGGRLLVADAEHSPWAIAPLRGEASFSCELTDPLVPPGQAAAIHHSPGVQARFHEFRNAALPEPVRMPAALPVHAVARHGGR